MNPKNTHHWVSVCGKRLATTVRWGLTILLAVAGLPSAAVAAGEADASNATSATATAKPLAAVLPKEKFHQLEQSVDNALAWISSQQKDDGSFPTTDQSQPAITSLCILAFLSRGHQCGIGPYGEQLNRAVDYVLSCQQPDGALSRLIPEITGNGRGYGPIARAGGYNHPFAGLMLGEVYGQVTGERERKVKEAIEKALQYSRAIFRSPSTLSWPQSHGGSGALWSSESMARSDCLVRQDTWG